MRPGEKEREREKEGEVKNAHDLTAQGTGASRTMPFKNFVLDPPSRNFFSPPPLPSPPATSARPPLAEAAHSLTRSPGLASKTMFPLFIDEYHYYYHHSSTATLFLRIDKINSQLFYSRPRYFSLLGKRKDNLSGRKEATVARKIRKGSKEG